MRIVFEIAKKYLPCSWLYRIFFGLFNKTEWDSVSVCVDDHFPDKE
jgi:hypothetical protein